MESTDAPAPLPDPSLPAALGDVEGAVLAILAAGPFTGRGLARALDRACPGLLTGREGHLYPLLADLESRGLLEARWVDTSPGPARRAYHLPGAAESGGETEGRLAGDGTTDPRLMAAAHDASRGIASPFARESARAEFLAHLGEAAADLAALGYDEQESARRAVEDLGDTWKIRTDLRRVHAGRPVVVFPRTLGERLRSAAIYDLAPLAVLLALVVLVRWQVVQAYNIPSGSMEPTLHGDLVDPDLILVDKTVFLRRSPRLWDIIVFYPPRGADRTAELKGEAPSAFVKRCTGLGGQSLELAAGDLLVDGVLARRPLDIEDAMMVPFYDMKADLKAGMRRKRFSPLASMIFDITWSMETGSWTVPSGTFAAEPGEEGEARLAFADEINNSYIDADGELETWFDAVGDVEVRFEARSTAPGAVVGADLTEGQERHRLRIGPTGLVVTSGERTWTRPEVRFSPGRPMRICFRNVDDRLTVRVDDEVVLREELPARAVRPKRTESAGVELVAEGAAASFSAVRILRDVQYLPKRESDWPVRVPAGHLFMMGDNTASSNDSREWGTVPEKNLVGVPFMVVYPPSRMHPLK